MKHTDTTVIHAGKIHDTQFGALTSPIYQTSTFVFDNVDQGSRRFLGEEDGYIYGRLGNPTIREFEQKMAVLEGTDDAAGTGSGMAAVSASVLANVKAGDHIITSEALYGCSHSFLEHICHNFGIETTFIDLTDPNQLVNALRPNTKLLYLETPINPHLTVVDIRMLVQFAKDHGLVTICDNTFMTPLLQKPAELGVDLIVHSVTKYLNGHGDVVCGVICGSDEQIKNIKSTTLKDIGGIMSPHDAWLILRGMKTLHLRVERHCSNGQRVAEFLESHPLVTVVHYPGLKSHPQHELAKSQMKAFGGVIAFEIDGDLDDGKAVMNHVKMARLAVSLGDAETLIQHPASMTHSPISREDRLAGGITDGLIRLSVGLEHPDDIIADINQALQHIKKATTISH